MLSLIFTGVTSPGDEDAISFSHTFFLIMVITILIAIPVMKNKFKLK